LTFPPGRLDQLLKEKKWTATDFARLMSVTSVQVRSWVKGDSSPRRKKLERFLQVFGLELEEQLYSAELAKQYSDTALQSIGLGNSEFGSLQTRFDGLAKARVEFWEALRAAYRKFVHDTSERRWGSLTDLLDHAPPPPGLPLPPGEHLLDYPRRHGRSLSDAAATLYRFSSAVYPPFVRGRELRDLSIVPEKAFASFHFARMDHATLFHRIGKLVFDNVMEFQQLLTGCLTAWPMINLIAYLEIALVQWCRDSGPGKVHLFHLNKAWHAHRRQVRGP
jgi:transcriptional regulator with XRE-family HTH domain